MHFWPKFGNADFNWWWLIARTSSKWGKFWLLSSIWPWSSRSIAPGNNRDLNQGLLHLWSKFGDYSLNSWLVIARTSWWLTDRHTHTHTQATTIPEGHNWPRVIIKGEWVSALHWRHNGRDSVSNRQPHNGLLNRLFRRRSKKTSKLRVTGLCVGNSPGTGEFPAQMASKAENVSIWWRHHGLYLTAFLWTAGSEVHIVHVSRVIIAYTLESLSSLT